MNGRARTILSVVIAVVVAIAFFFFFIRPKQGELSDVRAGVELEENQTQQLQAALTRLEQLRDNAPRLQADLDQIRELVPDENEVPNFIFQVQEAANQAGVRFVQITPELPKPPPEGAALAEVRLTIGATGGYFAIQDLFRRLYSLDRAVRLDNVTVSAEETEEEGAAAGDLSLSTIARIFFQLPEGAAAPADPEAEPDTETP